MDDVKRAIVISFTGGVLCGFSVGFGVGYVFGEHKWSSERPTAAVPLAYASAVLATITIVPLVIMRQYK